MLRWNKTLWLVKSSHVTWAIKSKKFILAYVISILSILPQPMPLFKAVTGLPDNFPFQLKASSFCNLIRLFNKGCRYSSMDSSAPTILPGSSPKHTIYIIIIYSICTRYMWK